MRNFVRSTFALSLVVAIGITAVPMVSNSLRGTVSEDIMSIMPAVVGDVAEYPRVIVDVESNAHCVHLAPGESAEVIVRAKAVFVRAADVEGTPIHEQRITLTMDHPPVFSSLDGLLTPTDIECITNEEGECSGTFSITADEDAMEGEGDLIIGARTDGAEDYAPLPARIGAGGGSCGWAFDITGNIALSPSCLSLDPRESADITATVTARYQVGDGLDPLDFPPIEDPIARGVRISFFSSLEVTIPAESELPVSPAGTSCVTDDEGRCSFTVHVDGESAQDGTTSVLRIRPDIPSRQIFIPDGRMNIGIGSRYGWCEKAHCCLSVIQQCQETDRIACRRGSFGLPLFEYPYPYESAESCQHVCDPSDPLRIDVSAVPACLPMERGMRQEFRLNASAYYDGFTRLPYRHQILTFAFDGLPQDVQMGLGGGIGGIDRAFDGTLSCRTDGAGDCTGTFTLTAGTEVAYGSREIDIYALAQEAVEEDDPPVTLASSTAHMGLIITEDAASAAAAAACEPVHCCRSYPALGAECRTDMRSWECSAVGGVPHASVSAAADCASACSTTWTFNMLVDAGGSTRTSTGIGTTISGDNPVFSTFVQRTSITGADHRVAFDIEGLPEGALVNGELPGIFVASCVPHWGTGDMYITDPRYSLDPRYFCHRFTLSRGTAPGTREPYALRIIASGGGVSRERTIYWQLPER